MHIFTK